MKKLILALSLFLSTTASAQLQVSTDRIDMPRTAVGQKSIATVTITNSSTVDNEVVTFSDVYVTESTHVFLIHGCRVLLPGRSCSWVIQFSPRLNQSYHAQLKFEGMNAGTSQAISESVKLGGQGFTTLAPARGGVLAGASH